MDKSRKPLIELGIEFVIELLLFLYPYGADQMGLPRNFWLGLGCWLVATVIAVRMFWIFPLWAKRLTFLEKSLMSFIGLAAFILMFYKPVMTAYRHGNGSAQDTKNTEQEESQSQQSTTPPTESSNPEVRPLPSPKLRPRKPHVNAAAPLPMSQECAPGASCAQSNGQQGGITGQVFIDTHPHLIMTDDQQASISQRMGAFDGTHAVIILNGNRADVSDFGKRVASILHTANIGGGSAGHEDGSLMLPFEINYGDKDVDTAQTLIRALIDNHVLSGKQIGFHYYAGTPGSLSIILTPPD